MVTFAPSPEKIWCALNVSNDCKGMLGISDCHVDKTGQLWNVCDPCVEHEQAGIERIKQIRRDD